MTTFKDFNSTITFNITFLGSMDLYNFFLKKTLSYSPYSIKLFLDKFIISTYNDLMNPANKMKSLKIEEKSENVYKKYSYPVYSLWIMVIIMGDLIQAKYPIEEVFFHDNMCKKSELAKEWLKEAREIAKKFSSNKKDPLIKN